MRKSSQSRLENIKSSARRESIQERGNQVIVSASGGVLVGVALSSIGLPAVIIGAIFGGAIGAILGGNIRTSPNIQSADEEEAIEEAIEHLK